MSSFILFLLRSVIEALGYCLERLAVHRHPVQTQVPALAFNFHGLLCSCSLGLPIPFGDRGVELFVEGMPGGRVHGAAVVPDVAEDHAFLRVTLPSHTVASLNVLRPVPEERGENECDLFFGRANVDTPGCEVRFRDKQIMAGFFVGEVQVGAWVEAGVELHDAHSLHALQIVSHFHQLLLLFRILHEHVGVVLQQDLASVAHQILDAARQHLGLRLAGLLIPVQVRFHHQDASQLQEVLFEGGGAQGGGQQQHLRFRLVEAR